MVELTRFGGVHVGGRPVEIAGRPPTQVSYSASLRDVPYDPNGHFWIEQAYVQFFVPARRRFATPLLLVHGGGLTGAVWEATAEGGSGWLQHFLAAGIATYVIDNAERGRAGFCCHPGIWTGNPIIRSDEEAWSLYRFGAAEDFPNRRPYPGQQFPTERMDVLARLTVPRWPANGPVLNAGLEAAVEWVGPCILLGHSQGGGLAMSVALTRPDLVRACILVEPHGFPAEMPSEAVRSRSLLLVEGDYIERSAEWRELSRQAREAEQAWRGSEGRFETVKLPEHGILGNSHLPMMDRNAEVVAALLVERLDRMHRAGCFD